MENKIINSNCKRCIDYEKKNCDGSDMGCMCKFCPRNLGVCMKVRWCRETESPIILEND